MRYLGALALVFVLAAVAWAQTLEEYAGRIRAAKESLSAAREDPMRSEEAARRLSEIVDLSVTTLDGETITVGNGWARGLAERIRDNGDSPAMDEALGKLDAIGTQVEELRAGKSTVLDAELAAGEEFGDGAAKPTIRDRNLGIRERLNRLADLLRFERKKRPVSHGTSVGIPTGMFIIVVLVIVGVVIGIIAYQIAKGRSAGTPTAPRASGFRDRLTLEDALKRTPEQWKALAREYFESGDYTQALRALYLSLLVVLHRRRLISYDSTKTNWEYVWEVSPAREEHKPFQVLTSAFDYKWYGRKECTRNEYMGLERMADTIVEQETEQA